MDLRGYEQAKFELSELLQSVERFVADDKDQAVKTRLHSLLIRLAEDRFNLVVAGRFSRGKSSLMNAILGMDRLPTGIVPLTSVITTVSYGTSEKVTLKYQQGRIDSEIKLEELPQYITEQGNPGNRRQIATANIELPAEILRRGFYFVDTPGLGSAILQSTQTTKAFLPETDALLLVTSFESPLSEDEIGFFEAATRLQLPIFVAINKNDLVSAAERDEAIRFVRSHLETPAGSPPEIFSVSARDGLSAKRRKEDTLLEASGVMALEHTLTRFLLERKRTAFLISMCSRVNDLVRDLPSFDGIDMLRQQARLLSERYGRSRSESPSDSLESSSPAFSRNQLRSCEICATVDSQAWDFLARYQYEIATDRSSQTDFAQRSGFCCYHTWEYQEVASPFGTSSGYPSLLERTASLLRTAAESGSDFQPLIDALMPTGARCVVCELRDRAENLALDEAAARLREDLSTNLEKLSALCLPHLAALARAAENSKIASALFRHHALTFERVAEDMRRLTLKQSATRRYLETKEEETAAYRGLMLLAGRRNVTFSFRAIQCDSPNQNQSTSRRANRSRSS